MCGIVGLAGGDLSLISRMNALLHHRGPDEGDKYIDQEAQVALAMRRLSILDLANGQQPMCNEDGSIWIVYNGEIFNSPQLRNTLKQRHTFKTNNSDTEVVLHLYEEQQEAMLNQLNGMFAFVIYDQKRGCLFGARDQLGIKPLYYRQGIGNFAFASELKSLLALPDVKRQLNPESLSHYLSLRYVPGEATIWQGIQRLPPAHWFRYDLQHKSLTIQSYWRLEFEPDSGPTLSEWSEQIQTELRQAVKRWTLSDVPIGCSLSGGLDSSSIVALLSQSGTQVKTYSLGFHGHEALDELPLARQIAQQWGTDHHELILEPDALLDALIPMVWHLDEPYGGGLPSWYIFQFMRQDVIVGLTGSGGDELFGNYGKYRVMEASGLERSYAAYEVARSRSQSLAALWHGMRVHLPSWRQHPLRLYQHFYYTDAEKRAFVLRDMSPHLTSDFLIEKTEIRTELPRNQIMYTDFNMQLPEEFLFMTDRFSMAHSLEARVPFLDKDLVDLVRRIPAELRTRPNDPKYLLRQAMKDLLPPAVHNASKRGFVLPIDAWLRGALRGLVTRLLAPEYLQQQGIFQPAFYHRMVEPHLQGRANYGERIWTVLMFQLWYAVFVEAAAVEQPSLSWQDLC